MPIKEEFCDEYPKPVFWDEKTECITLEDTGMFVENPLGAIFAYNIRPMDPVGPHVEVFVEQKPIDE